MRRKNFELSVECSGLYSIPTNFYSYELWWRAKPKKHFVHTPWHNLCRNTNNKDQSELKEWVHQRWSRFISQRQGSQGLYSSCREKPGVQQGGWQKWIITESKPGIWEAPAGSLDFDASAWGGFALMEWVVFTLDLYSWRFTKPSQTTFKGTLLKFFSLKISPYCFWLPSLFTRTLLPLYKRNEYRLPVLSLPMVHCPQV